MLNVENKVVIITGASSGIGEATAKLLAKNGAKVVLGARRIDSHSERLRQRLETIAKEIHADGGIAEYQALDVTQRRSGKNPMSLTSYRTLGRSEQSK
nr:MULTISPECIES: SDR family NAD(P)-dependent oxidoreductase [unclassified Chamaesiphon]